MPTATDLVTDLPADFEVFGQAVATSMADLLGGTSGQILAKNSNTDMDFVWVANDVGDITAVTAGTGISGGGTSGAVTITNSMATEITAKGDLIVGTGSATFDNVPVGTNGQTLVADSTASTGLKWAAPTAPSLAGVRAVKSALQSIPNATYTSVAFDAADTYDTNSFHNPSSNNTRITIPTGGTGYYQIFGMITWVPAANHLGVMNFYKNGSSIMSFNIIATGNSSYQQSQFMTDVQYLTAGDYIEIQVYQNLGSAINVQGNTSDAQSSFFGVNFLGA